MGQPHVAGTRCPRLRRSAAQCYWRDVGRALLRSVRLSCEGPERRLHKISCPPGKSNRGSRKRLLRVGGLQQEFMRTRSMQICGNLEQFDAIEIAFVR